MIPNWSKTNPKVKEILLPTIKIDWSDLSTEDKKNMWKYLEINLFNPDPDNGKARFDNVRCNYEFYGENMWENDYLVKDISWTMQALNDSYKKKSYARNYLEDSTYNSACFDFHRIFMHEEKDVVFEMLTIFSNVIIVRDKDRLSKNSEESDEDFKNRIDSEKWKRFDSFKNNLNEVFEDFGIDYKLTRAGFIISDEPVVIDKIYEPALKKLSAQKWVEANRDLKDAFSALRDDKDGSGAITHVLSALQGFLQVLVYGKTGKGDTAALINEALKKQLIPDDDFSKKIIKEMISFWARERAEKGDPHPKKFYATKNQAKLVVGLVLVFVDYVL